jgi:hypothetical protein
MEHPLKGETMSFRATLLLGTLVWSFGVTTLILHAPQLRTSTAPELQEPIEEASLEIPPEDASVALPYAILDRANGFYAAAVGFAALTPDEVLAWRVISHSPRGQATFEDLFRTASVPGKLYALAGLWLGDRERFHWAAKVLAAQGGTVRTMRGCIMAQEPVARLIKQIEEGTWSREFLMGRR